MLLWGALILGFTGGLLLLLGAAGVRLPLGRLPGDISWRKGNTRIYIPIATSLLISLILTVVLNLLVRR